MTKWEQREVKDTKAIEKAEARPECPKPTHATVGSKGSLNHTLPKELRGELE